MAEQTPLLKPEYLARLKSLTLRARTVVDGALTGLHKSPHHGSSVEFAEHKEYAQGDEIRHIDWRVYARSDKYYVRRFEQETNLQAVVLVDGSSSMLYKSDDAICSKWEYASILAASLAYLMLRQQDAVGLTVADEKVRTYVPPRSRSTHLMHLCELLLAHVPQEGTRTSLYNGTRHLLEVLERRGLIFILSDFLDTDERYFQVIKQLKSRRQHVHLFQILDPWELRFPFDDMTIFKSLESGRRVLAEPRSMREIYLREVGAFVDSLRARCLENGFEYRLMDTSVELEEAFRTFVVGARNGR